jgi:hypothetical protein
MRVIALKSKCGNTLVSPVLAVLDHAQHFIDRGFNQHVGRGLRITDVRGNGCQQGYGAQYRGDSFEHGHSFLYVLLLTRLRASPPC